MRLEEDRRAKEAREQQEQQAEAEAELEVLSLLALLVQKGSQFTCFHSTKSGGA